jgi:tryptophan 2,3-dioxygenase
MPLTYSNYLKLDQLLDLQQLQSNGTSQDEMLFVIVHQTYELWFKEMLHEIDILLVTLETRDIVQARTTLRRIRCIFKLLVSQMDVLETMTAPQFLAFRDLLGNASGFQSVQFRELEFAFGKKNVNLLQAFPENSPERVRLQKRFESASIWDSFVHYLSQCSYAIPAHVLNRDLSRTIAPSRQVQSVLLQVYKNDRDLADFCELLLDVDEGIQEWRYRHVKMVERIIGSKQGTGGSSGVEYLKSTLFIPCFPDLWAIRSEFKR